MSRRTVSLGVLVAVVFGVASLAFVRWREIVTARHFVAIAAGLMDERKPFDAGMNSRLGIPPALRTRDQAITYYLLQAVELDGGRYSGAYYVLGRYLVDKDCEVSLHYFLQHCDTHDCDSQTTEFIERIRKYGCQAALAGPPLGED